MAATVPKRTEVASARCAPEIVTTVPPRSGPAVTDSPVTTGGDP